MSKHTCIKHITSVINCGYARVAIRSLSKPNHGGAGINKAERMEMFRRQFKSVPSYFPDPSIFESSSSSESAFDRGCKKILTQFSQKWHPTESRCSYTATFSVENWKQLPNKYKQTHTMSNCQGCLLEHPTMQTKFPGHTIIPIDPVMPTVHALTTTITKANTQTAKATTRKALGELNEACQQAFGYTFSDAITRHCPEEKLQKKPTETEKKRAARKALRKCKDHLQKHMGENDALNVLAENQSLNSYKRMRLSQSFETPQQKRERYQKQPFRQRKHSPKFDNVSWDKEKVQTDLQSWPQDEKMNWSHFAREHGILAKNGGQIVKEFANEIGMDTTKFDGQPKQQRMRARKLRMPGGEIAVPCHKTPQEVKADWDQMIQSQRLTLGEPCAPYTLTKYSVVNGQLQKTEMEVYGIKIPLLEIRKKLLKRHEEYMHLHTDKQLQEMSRIRLLSILQNGESSSSNEATHQELVEMVARLERTRSIAIWHDHSTVLGQGYILITAKVVYDPMVFKTQEEIESESSTKMEKLQSMIEQPELHMLVACSSSLDDQATLISDRNSCMRELSVTLPTSNGIQIRDELVFFYGDKPAQQVERGTQQGGTYKCGSCGCPSHMMDDLAYSLNCEWRSLDDIQSLALAGKYGKQPHVVRPFKSLNTDQLQQELRARNILHTATTKADLQKELARVLAGVQRVPTLLLENPTQPLSTLNMQRYCILDCEPLHDLKGHLSHLFAELSYVLSDQDITKEYKDLIGAELSKDKVTGGDYRRAAIRVLALLKDKVPQRILLLLQTIVEISEILYAEDVYRTPKTILRLHNLTWLHHELCCDIFKHLHATSKESFFGLYLHALSCHASMQYEIVCLRSCNAENEERLFGQAKLIAKNATNRKPENVLPNIILRLQAKQERQDIFRNHHKESNIISKEAKKVSIADNTAFDAEFIQKRLNSWQAHLQNIAHYLVLGENVWWHKQEGSYQFCDGASEPHCRPEGPHLKHFRNSNYADVKSVKSEAWTTILCNNITLPTPRIKLFDAKGNFIAWKSFSPENTPIPDTTDQAMEQSTFGPDPTNTYTSTPTDQTDQQPMDTNENEPNTTDDHTVYITENLPFDLDALTAMESQPMLHSNTADSCESSGTHDKSSDAGATFATKAASAYYRILGNEDTYSKIKEFDQLKSQIKERTKSVNPLTIAKYKNILAELQQHLILYRRQLREQIRQYEAKYYEQHHKLPTAVEDGQYKEMLVKTKLTKKLLELDNITL